MLGALFALFWPAWFSSRLLPSNLSDTPPLLSPMPTLLCTTWAVVPCLKLSVWTGGRTEKCAKVFHTARCAEGQRDSRRGPDCHLPLHSNVSLSIFRGSGSDLIKSVITVTNTTKMFLFNGMAVQTLSQAEICNEVKPRWCWHTCAKPGWVCGSGLWTRWLSKLPQRSRQTEAKKKQQNKKAWNYFCTHLHVNV